MEVEELVDYEDAAHLSPQRDSDQEMTHTGDGALAHASLGDAMQVNEQKIKVVNDSFPRYLGDLVNGFADNMNWNALVAMSTETFSQARLKKEAIRRVPFGREKLDMALNDVIRHTKRLELKNKNKRRAKFAYVVDTDDAEYKHISEMLTKCYQESPTYTLRLVFHIRDARKGKGRRDVFRMCIRWYVENGHSDEISKFVHLVPEYGRWDDVLYCPGGIELMAKQLVADRAKLDKNGAEGVSLAAKWIPTASNKRRQYEPALREAIRKELNKPQFNERDYRKFVQPLRARLNLVETNLGKRQYEKVEYNKVPSRAMALYSKRQKSDKSVHEKRRKTFSARAAKQPSKYGGAFVRNDGQRLNAFNNQAKDKLAAIQAAIASGEMKEEEAKEAIQKVIKFDQLYVHELVCRYMNEGVPEDATLENQWSAWVAKLSTVKALQNVVPMVDVSSSMSSPCAPDSPTPTCTNVSVALGLLIARCNTKDWANQMLTFESQPQLVTIDPAVSLHRAVQDVCRLEWGGSTNIEAAFHLLLNEVKTKNKTMPRALIVFTDMNFDAQSAGYRQSYTPFESVRQQYKLDGYELPTIVFWNLSAQRLGCYPVKATTPNTILLSGFSTATLELLFGEGKDWDNFVSNQPVLEEQLDPYGAVQAAAPVPVVNPWIAVATLLDTDRYNHIIV
jgi:hypothetical protein